MATIDSLIGQLSLHYNSNSSTLLESVDSILTAARCSSSGRLQEMEHPKLD